MPIVQDESGFISWQPEENPEPKVEKTKPKLGGMKLGLKKPESKPDDPPRQR